MSDYTTNLAERTEYLHQLGYSPWMKDEPFKGLNVLEGLVSLLDFRKSPTTKINMQGRILLGRGIQVPREVDTQIAMMYGEDATLLQELFIRGLIDLVGNNIGIHENHPELGILIDRHAGSGDVTTLLYSHGEPRDGELRLFIESPKIVGPSIEQFLSDYKAKFFEQNGSRPPILVSACNQEEGEGVLIKNEDFDILYRLGKSGGVFAKTGRLKLNF